MFFEFVVEEFGPIADAAKMAESFAPILVRDFLARRDARVELLAIMLDPGEHAVAPAHRAHRLSAHRSVIRESAAELGTVIGEHRERFIEIRIVRCGHVLMHYGASVLNATLRSSLA